MATEPVGLINLAAGRGRIRLELTAIRVGGDLQVILGGGAAHIGATALADGVCLRVAGLEGHREEELAGELARFLADGLGCAVAFTAGIHYDAITTREIADVIALARSLCQRLLSVAGENANAYSPGSERIRKPY